MYELLQCDCGERKECFQKHAVEWEKGLKRYRNDNLSMSESVALLADIIFQREVVEGNSPIVAFSQLRSIIEEKDKRLNSLFDEIEESAHVERKSETERRELNRSLAYQCYLMCWNRNKAILLWDLRNELPAGEEFTWVDGVAVLTNLLYDREKKQNQQPIYSFQELRREMELALLRIFHEIQVHIARFFSWI
jgi:hypothetical protein